MHRVVHPVCLGSRHSSRAATATTGPRLSTQAGARHPARRLLPPCAAGEAGSSQHDGLPQQQRADEAEAAVKPTARKRNRIRRSKAMPWNADVEAAVLQFWIEQGALLSEAEVQPKQQTEQRQTRSKIMRWAAKYPRHRDLQFLTDYMARVTHAVAGSQWADKSWHIALSKQTYIPDNSNPASVLQRVLATKKALGELGVCISSNMSLSILAAGLSGKTTIAKAAKLQQALDTLPVTLDFAKVVERAPGLLRLVDSGAVLKRRVAAMQQLHSELDVAQVSNQQPSLLNFTEETLAAHWASLQLAGGLGDDDMRALVESHPGVLNRDVGVVEWKVRQVRPYDVARESAAVGRTPVSGLARVVTAASFRVWRLCYMSEAKTFSMQQRRGSGWEKQTLLLVTRGTARGLPRTPSLLQHISTDASGITLMRGQHVGVATPRRLINWTGLKLP